MCPITKHATPFSASFSGAAAEQADQLCVAIRQREEVLGLAHQLVQLLRMVQRHRGISMGLLAGNEAFASDFDALQHALERRLAYIQAYAGNTPLLEPRDHDNLHNAWLTLSRGWQDDEVMDNFELHCHALDQLLDMLARLAKHMAPPLIKGGIAPLGEAAKHYSRQRELLSFCTAQLPQMVEQIGRVRGLATYAVSFGQCNHQHGLKLRYSLQRVYEQSDAVRRVASQLSDFVDVKYCNLAQVKAHDIKLKFLLDQVETELLKKTKPSISGQQVYILATDIIDGYFSLIEEGIALVFRWNMDDLEAWVKA